MIGVILAGGKGTRLRPITETLPKPFVKVDGKPALEYLVDALVRDGFNDILMTMYYKPEDIIEHFGSGLKWKSNMIYSFEDTPLGTFGGVIKNKGILNETFIVSNGDVLIDIDFKELYDFHKRKGAVATIALTPVEDPTQFGIVGMDENGRIERFLEKPSKEEAFSNLINAGVYILEPEVLELFPFGTNVDFAKDLFPKLLEMGKPIYGKRLTGFWLDIGRPADLIYGNINMFPRNKGTNLYISSGVLDNVKVRGNCFIGENVKLGRGVVMENVYVYDGCRIGDNVKLKNVVIAPNSAIGEGSRLSNSYI